MEGSLETPPRPRGWRGKFGGLSSLGTQVEGLLELFFLISSSKFRVRDLIEDLLELLLLDEIVQFDSKAGNRGSLSPLISRVASRPMA